MLNIFNDPDYNRSVITIVASVDSVSKCRPFYTCGEISGFITSVLSCS